MGEYIVSARKYRPASFDSVVGQTALTTTLRNAVKSGKLAHAYLFCGPRGVGKTTCARIFAKAINCMHPTPEGEACGECESCKAFAEQRSYNIFELDAASNNSVEHIKSLMEQTRIPPQVGKYKVFIIDEVHMLSQAAFNAFLKTLEEPPAHVIFILATTEKHKILPTILSRCQIYDFERMTVENTIAHLKHVAQKEGITYEDEALAVIAEKADGGMRDALSIFDQAVSFCQGNLTYQKVTEDLNVLDSDNYFKLIDCALENNVSEMMLLLNGILDKGFDGGNMIQGLAQHVRNVLMAKDAKTLPLLETSEAQKAKYQQQAQKAPTPFLYKALLGYYCQRLLLVADAFLLCHHLEVVDGVGHGHALKVVYLASAQDGRQNLVFLGGGEDEDDVLWRLLQCLKEGIEGCRAEHVYLVDDKHLVLSDLWRYARLLHQLLDVVHTIVAGGVELKDVVRPLFVERLAALALVACLAVLLGVLAVDGLGEDTRAGGLSHSSRTAEEVCVSEFSALHRILERSGKRRLSHHRVEAHRAVLAGGYNVFFHTYRDIV